MKLKNLASFLPGSKLFTTEAVKISPNINRDEYLTTVRSFFKANNKALPKDYPTNDILDLEVLVLRNNIFHFAET